MLRQASSYMVAHGVSAVLGFAAIVIFTRLLDPAQYGLYVVGMSLAGIVNAVLFAWIRLSILRFQSEGPSADIRVNAIVGYGLSVALSPLVALVLLAVTGAEPVQIVLAAMVALALGLFEFGQEVFKAQQNAGAYARAAIVRAIATLALSLAMIGLGLGGDGLLLGICGAYCVTALVFAPRIWRGPVRRFDGPVFRQMLAFGAPMAFSGAVFALHAALDRLIVVYFLGDAAAGVYGASADLVRQIILFPAMAVGSAMAPMVIRSLAEGGRQQADAQLLASGELLLAALLPAVVGLAIVAPSFSQLMLGADFRETAAVLIPILVFAWLFQALTHQYVQLSFHLAKTSRLLLIQGVVILSVNVIATVALVPSLGLVGAAWALVIAEGCGVVAGYWLAGRAYPLPLSAPPILRVLGATLAMAIPTLLVSRLTETTPLMSLLVAIPTGIVCYGLAAIALDVMGLRDRVLAVLRRRLGLGRTG